MTELIKNIYAIEVPKGAYDFQIGYDWEEGKLRVDYRFQKTGNRFEDLARMAIEIQIENWMPNSTEILGTVTPDTIDFDVSGIVETFLLRKIASQLKHRSGVIYRDYTDNVKICSTVDDSFRSLMTSKGLDPTKHYLIIRKKLKG